MSINQNKKLSDFKLMKYGYPDANGHYGVFGGTFVAETLIEPLENLRDMYHKLKKDEDFLKELYSEYENYVGRPTPLYFAERLTNKINGANIFLKREDLPNNCYTLDDDKTIGVLVSRVGGQKCERCWKYFSKLTDNVCIRCKEVIE